MSLKRYKSFTHFLVIAVTYAHGKRFQHIIKVKLFIIITTELRIH